MYYRIPEDELFELIREAYRKGLHNEGTSNSVAEEIVRRHRDKIEPQETPRGYYWDTIMSPDMMCADDEGTYIQEMGTPPPVIFGPGPVGPDTPWRDVNGNLFKRSKNEDSGKN